ncbi:anti-sigma factor [Agromyces neolithicus]|uniref:Regulator of SigK n=1 Tax=Agromyces neolithicus TaxID=269420 RepID=A0ABN2M5B1_9MICO
MTGGDDMTEPRDHDREHDREHDDERVARDVAALEAMHELAAAHALDALDAEERAAFEAAAAASPQLRAEADSYAESAAVLGALAEPVEPPPGLKQRLVAQLDGLPQQQPASRALAHARRRWFERPGAILGAAAAAIILIAGVVIGVGWPGPNGWGAQLEMAAIAAAPDARSQTHEVAGGGEITLVSSAERGRSGVVVSGLPELAADQTYELWYLDDSGAASAGTFDVSGDETRRVLEGEFIPGVAVGVTVEPAGGSPQPTTEPIVVIPT